MKKYVLLLGVYLLSSFFPIQAQILNPTLQNMVPPAPGASALEKFGNIPVSNSTGIPGIGIPVYSYQGTGNGLKFSISLDYHAGGIRVDEVASNVGIGWALNAGGVISRTVRGIPDEKPDYGFMFAGPLPVNQLEGNTGSSLELRQYSQIHASMRDNEPDLFSFNFNGHSGRFIYGKNNDLLVINQQKLKIEKEIGIVSGEPLIKKFIITDELGTTYQFEAAEVITTLGLIWPTAKTYTSSWYLTKISSASGKEHINITYENTGYSYQVSQSLTEVVILPGKPLPSKSPSGSTSAANVSGQRIKTITFPNNVVSNFTYSTTQRQDLPGDHLLQKIDITFGNSKRGVILEHNYSTNRATLSKVTPFSGVSETPSSPYLLEYDPTPLPARFSVAQDHWGFYNTNQGSMIPREGFSAMLNSQVIKMDLQGGNRDTDPERVKAGTLRKMTYPTGGYTIFEMEANRAKDARLSQETVTNVYYRDAFTSVYCTNSNSTITNFPFEGDPNSQTDMKFKLPSVSGYLPGETKIFIELRTPNNTLLDVFEIDPVNPSGTEVELNITKSYLTPGNYTLTTYTQGLSNFYTYIDFSWHETRILNPVKIITGHVQHYVGGLRAKKITDYAFNGQAAGSREYEYLLDDGTSSGTLGVYPVYTYPVYYDYRSTWVFIPPNYTEPYAGQAEAPNALVRSTTSAYFLAYANGSPVTYSKVIERIRNNGQDAGRTERFFSSFYDVPVTLPDALPYTAPQYKEWTYGLLRFEKIFDKDNNLISWKENQYNFTTDNYFQDPVRFENFRGISLTPVKYMYTGQNPVATLHLDYWLMITEPCYFLSRDFYPDAGKPQLVKTISRLHSSPANYVQTEVDYTYDVNNFYLKKEVHKDSRGDILEQQMNYPKDMVSAGNDPTGIYTEMASKNIIESLVEHTLLKNNTPLKYARTNYFKPHNNVYVPLSVEVKNPIGLLDKRIQYEQYDDMGKLLEVSKTGDTKISYIWGYNNQYVVAECSNSLRSDCFYEGFETADGNSSEFKAGKLSRINGYQKNLTALSNGNYMLSYWTKADGSWKLIQTNVNITNNTYSISLSGHIDEIRLHPFNAKMTTYTYDPLFGLTTESDANHRLQYFEYDDFGRLKLIRDENGKILKQIDYQYQSSAL